MWAVEEMIVRETYTLSTTPERDVRQQQEHLTAIPAKPSMQSRL
jgi:hypothetical protein